MLNCCSRAIHGKLSEAVDLAEEGRVILTITMKARTAFKQERLENE